MPSGPSLSFNGTYPDRVAMMHTMDPAYFMAWRRFPSGAQQVAVQQLNEQGLYPTKNNRADFSGGQYPATIKLAPTNAPGCEGYARAGSSCPCNGCCPGQRGVPMRDIVARQSCSRCDSAAYAGALQAPGEGSYDAYGRMATVNRHQAQQLGRQVPDAWLFGRYGGRAQCRGCSGV